MDGAGADAFLVAWRIPNFLRRLFAEGAFAQAFVPVLAYPWGEYSDAAQDALRKSPYQFAFTTDKHRWTSEHSPYAIPRYSAYYRDGNPLILLGKLCRHNILFG